MYTFTKRKHTERRSENKEFPLGIGGGGWGGQSSKEIQKKMASGLSGLQSGLAVVKPLQSKAAVTTSATTTTLGGIQSGNGGYCMLIYWN